MSNLIFRVIAELSKGSGQRLTQKINYFLPIHEALELILTFRVKLLILRDEFGPEC